jgi:hypothetical protein
VPKPGGDYYIDPSYYADLPWPEFQNLVPRWTRFCWWLSKKLNRSVFGKREFTVEQWDALTPEEQAKELAA